MFLFWTARFHHRETLTKVIWVQINPEWNMVHSFLLLLGFSWWVLLVFQLLFICYFSSVVELYILSHDNSVNTRLEKHSMSWFMTWLLPHKCSESSKWAEGSGIFWGSVLKSEPMPSRASLPSTHLVLHTPHHIWFFLLWDVLEQLNILQLECGHRKKKRVTTKQHHGQRK